MTSSRTADYSMKDPIQFDNQASLQSLTSSSSMRYNEADVHMQRNPAIQGLDSMEQHLISNTEASSAWISPSQLLPLFSTPSTYQDFALQSHSLFASTSGQLFDGARGLEGMEDMNSILQQDNNNNNFYPQSPNMDVNSDFSFLHRRSASSCSQSIQQYIHSRSSSSAGLTDASPTPESTPKKKKSISSRLETTPTPKSILRRPLSQQRQRKLRSESSRPGSVSGRSTRSDSTTTMNATAAASVFANTKKLPLRLPRPPLCLLSDPYADLCSHLRRHGMEVEADTFESAPGITADFALRGWIQTSVGGAIGLLNQTNVFLEQHSSVVKTQMEMAKYTSSKTIPRQISVSVSDLDATTDENGLTPTHILAVHGSGVIGKDGSKPEEAKGILIPCHALMYTLQSVSLPAFPPSLSARQEGETLRILPIVSLRVPRPSEFPTLHRFIYTHDASALLVELLPMKHIARHWDHLQSKQADATTPPNSATDALSHLPTQTLLGYAYKIHSGWANGVAIGLLEAKYWSTLDRAWNLIMAALSIKKARLLDAEQKKIAIQEEGTQT